MSLTNQRRREPLNRHTAAFLLAGISLLVVAFAVLLRRFPPEQYSFYPVCPIYAIFHLKCPGCGSTRALAALLRGNWHEALHENALFVLGVLPATLIYGMLCASRLLRRENRVWPVPPKPLIYASLSIALAFGILRNLPL